MKRLRKLVLVMLALVMLINNPTSVFAAQQSSSDEIISFEEYYSAMKAEYAKFGHTYEVLQKNDDFVYTKKILEENLKIADQRLKDSQENLVVDVSVVDSGNTTNKDNVTTSELSTMASSLINVTKYLDFRIYDQYTSKASAGFRIEAKLTDNPIAGYFYSFDSCNVYQYGTYTFLNSWSLLSLNYYLSSDKKRAVGSLTIRITFEYTEPSTGILVGDTFDSVNGFGIPES